MSRELQDLMAKYGTDKDSVHSYGNTYAALFGPIKDTTHSVLEIGVASGASLRVWRDYFQHAIVYGVDIDPAATVTDDRIVTFTADATDYKQLITAVAGGDFDVIIDDGDHQLAHQLLTLFFLWPFLRPGGLYCIEDVQEPEVLENYSRVDIVTVYDLRHERDRYDDVLTVLRKPPARA